MDYVLLGKNIAKARSKNHLTQEQLAEKVDVSTVFISQLETAVRKPSLETIYKISVALNTTLDNLIGNVSLETKYNEIANLLQGKNDIELLFITNVLREICSQIKDGKLIDE